MDRKEERKHGDKWTSEELEIVYKNYTTKTIRQIAEMIPTRSISAVKNKIKQVKFGKYKKKRLGGRGCRVKPNLNPFNAAEQEKRRNDEH